MTKQDWIDACLMEYCNDLDISRAEHKRQLEEDTYEGVRYYYYYYRRVNQYEGRQPKTIIRNGKICKLKKGEYKVPIRCGPRNYVIFTKKSPKKLLPINLGW